MSNGCVFCMIIAKEIPSEIIFEDSDAIAIKDISPRAPIHYLLIPKRHFCNLTDMADSDTQLVGKLALIARDIAKKEDFDRDGFRFVANNGLAAGQEVDHLHFHLLAGRKLGSMG